MPSLTDFDPALLQDLTRIVLTRTFIGAYCATLLLMAAGSVGRFRWKSHRIHQDLRKAVAVLREAGQGSQSLSENPAEEGQTANDTAASRPAEKASNATVDVGPAAEKRHEFYRNLRVLNEAISSNRTLSHAWQEFTESFVFPEVGGQEWIGNSKEPSAHFDLGSVVEPTINLRAYASVPNYLTGLGILGTFIGLSAGIYIAQLHIAPVSDPAAFVEMQTGLRALLSGASLAFLTSICGLGSSIAFLYWERRSVGRLAREIQIFNSELDTRLELITPEKQGAKQLTQLRRQTIQLERFNTDLAVSIASALDEKLTGRLVPKLDELIGAVEGMRSDQKEANEDVLKSVVGDFRDAMTGAAGREIEALSGTLGSLNDGLLLSSEQLAERTSDMEQAVKGMRTELQGSLTDSAAVLKRSLEESLGQMTSELAVLAGTIKTTLGDAGESAAQVLGDAVGRLSKDATNRMGESFKLMEHASRSITRRLAETTRQIDAQAKISLEAAAAQAEEGRRTVDSLSSAQASMVEVASGFARMHSEFQDLLPSLRAASDQFRAAAQANRDSVRSIEVASSNIGAAATTMTESQSKVTSAWDAYRNRFEAIDVALQAVFGQIEQGLERYTEKVAKSNSEFDGHMSQAVRSLGGVVSEMSDTLEDFRGIVQQIQA